MSDLKAAIDARVMADIIAFARQRGWTEAADLTMLEWLEEKLDEPNMAHDCLVRTLRVCQAHGYPDTGFPGFLEWLEQRLESSDQLVLKEAELELGSLFSSPKQPERSEFARKLRRGQERSAQQAMLIMASDLQQAYQKIALLEGQLTQAYGETGWQPRLRAVEEKTDV